MTEARSPNQSEGRVPQVAVDWQAALAEHDRWLRMVVRAGSGIGRPSTRCCKRCRWRRCQKAPLADASKVAPWLYRLAVRQVLLYRRKHGRRRNLVDRFARDTQPTEADQRTVDPLQWLLADDAANKCGRR